ncbi:lamin tail domain-containing protein 1 [Strigops habroptila]|uniref:lamin tail domain-containing protein 1 n=1 Tax=Strigops habroptila TaxID=2489341 RepID=UPI0011D00E61|nr:lamin tail domain-containing protein 1 [Strigops habroptila]
MMVPGQRCFSSLFTDSRKIAQSLRQMQNPRRRSSTHEEYQEFASSAIGNLKIAEVDPDGRFVKIRNHAREKDENIGGYLLKQDVKGQPVAVFRFPSETRMEPSSTVTVWAADTTVLHKFPSDLLWKDLRRFRTSLDCATILCEPSGQAVAWYTPLYWTTRQGLMATEESEEPENIVIPTFSTTKEGWENEQESIITDTEWNRADSWQASKKRQSFIKREKKTFASLFPNQSPWCQSPNAPTHPHFSLARPLTMGNDGSSLCRQSRCQSSRPDPVPGTLYAGTSQKKNPSVPSCVSGKGRSQPPWLAVEEEKSHIPSEQYDSPGCASQDRTRGINLVQVFPKKKKSQNKPYQVLRLNGSSSGDANDWDLTVKILSPVCQQCDCYDPVVVKSRLQPMWGHVRPKHFVVQDHQVQVPNNRSTDMTLLWSNRSVTRVHREPDCSYEFQTVIEPLIKSGEQQ